MPHAARAPEQLPFQKAVSRCRSQVPRFAIFDVEHETWDVGRATDTILMRPGVHYEAREWRCFL
jgi:hypothetical protein